MSDKKLFIVVRYLRDGTFAVCGDGKVFIGNLEGATEVKRKLDKANPGETYVIHQTAELNSTTSSPKRSRRGIKSTA